MCLKLVFEKSVFLFLFVVVFVIFSQKSVFLGCFCAKIIIFVYDSLFLFITLLGFRR